ncbi:MAG: hypothetical protein RLY71_82 [Pseudomonadota bacterium]|jgi:predicted metal-dependent hydrolase
MSRTPGTVPPPQLLRHRQANRELLLGEHLVGYALHRATRRTIGFLVNQDGLAVRAPRGLDQSHIDAALRMKASWILRKLADQGERLRQLDASRPRWQHGMALPYLGERLRIELQPDLPGQPGTARLLPAAPDSTAASVLQLRLAADSEPAAIRHAVQSWLQEQARALFTERCRHYASRMHVQPRRLALSSARTRWGSANSEGHLRLNWRLIHHAPATIDYVVVHELAHLREMNHSPAFWAIVAAVLPDYETQRLVLKNNTTPVLD